jgi:MFS family permease
LVEYPGAAVRRKGKSLVNPGQLTRFDAQERRVVAALSAVYAIRMLGMFMLLPVLALFAHDLPDATPLTIGLAMGAYGLAQALLQIPFGRWSDRFGRKPVIVLGFLLYFAGSVVGALAAGIHMVIAARAIQGAGAVSGPVTALLADLTRAEVRTRAMAFIGISIGACFILSLLAGPPLSALLGLAGFFWAMALIALAALLAVVLFVPTPARAAVTAPSSWRHAFSVGLVTQYCGVFTLHFVLMSTFVAVPHVLREIHHIPTADHWQTYLLVFVLSLGGTAPMIMMSEKSRQPGRLVAIGIALLVLAQLVMAFDFANAIALHIGLTLYFVAFNFLEARLPARVSELAPGDRRGAALGVFATSQFLGAFAGGTLGGVLLGSAGGLGAVFAAAGVAASLWWVIDRAGSQHGGPAESAASH